MASMNFTVKALESIALPPEGQRFEFWDESLPGFGIRVTSAGKKSWSVMYRVNDRLRRMTLGSFGDGGLSLADARVKAKDVLAQAAKGLDPGAEKIAARLAQTYDELGALYVGWASNGGKSSWREDKRMLDVDVLPHWKHLKVKDIGKKDVRALLNRVLARGAKVHANRVFALVRRIFNFAIEHDVIAFNPCAAMNRPTPEKARERVLSVSELKAVWTALDAEEDPILAGAIRLGLLLAQRPGEIKRMRWNQIDLSERVWTIPGNETKNELAHRVPLSEEALRYLFELRQLNEKSEWVFPRRESKSGRIHGVRPAIERLRERLGIHFTAHDLRRTAASHMAAAGVPRLVVGKILNHAEQGVTRVYDRHGYDAEKRQALELWSCQLLEMVAKPRTEWSKVIQLRA